jgi:BCD family chlorophyll transporter-like MFS transporter
VATLWALTTRGPGVTAAGEDPENEPYGGEVLHLGVGATTGLTALLATGTLIAFAMAAKALEGGTDPYRIAGYGALAGVVAFSAVIFAGPFESAFLFRCGTALIGFGGGLFSVGMLTGAMNLVDEENSGLALGAWGAVQAAASGIAIAAGGVIRDVMSGFAASGVLGPALVGPAVGYGFVYYIEIMLLLVTLAAVGPLVRPASEVRLRSSTNFGLSEFPG